MFSTFNEKEEYSRLMEYIKKENTSIKRIYSSERYKTGKILSILSKLTSRKGRSAARKYFKNWIDLKRVKRKFPDPSNKYVDLHTPNYFSEERIAIYTCIIGKYDSIIEPGFIPDNCDYYIITDQPVPVNSRWKTIDIHKYDTQIVGLNNIEINRFFKMMPHILFPEYKYSIYLDGNIKPVSDLTEFINLIGACGIAAHKHSIREDVYREAEVLKVLKKDTPDRINKHIEHLRNTGMPEQYGLIECNVIAREHHNPLCMKVMQDWWNEFRNYSKRDQISFVHVLFINGITVDEVGTLGNNVFENPALRKVGHN